MEVPQRIVAKEGLYFIRMAHKRKDGAVGLLYLHNWLTGWEFLVFPSREAAEDYRKQHSIPLPRLVPKN